MSHTTLLVIGDETVIYGFGLLGISGCLVETEEQARRALDEALDGRAEIVLITAQWATALRERVDALKSTSLHPLVLELPAGNAGQSPQDDVRTLLRQALGIPVGPTDERDWAGDRQAG